MIHPDAAGTTSVPLRLSVWRDLLVRSAAQHWIIYSASAGATSTPLRAGTTGVPLPFDYGHRLTQKSSARTARIGFTWRGRFARPISRL